MESAASARIAEPANAGHLRRLLVPFDVVEPIARRSMLRIVRRGRWRRTLRAALAADSPAGSLTAAADAGIDLLPFQQVTRDETEARVISPEPWLEPWPPAPERILPDLIAYHRHRAHRWRARVMRRAIRSVWRSIPRLCRSRVSGNP